MKKIYFTLAALFFAAVSLVTLYMYRSIDKAYDVTPLFAGDIAVPEGTDKLMIVAHPDDDMIWGGAHLLEGGWFVVCLTHGDDSVRSDEFSRAVTESGNTPLILSYPDKVNFRRDDWSRVSDSIEADIETILKANEWQTVATHNPQGEYGHIHHKLTSALTTSAFTGTGSGKLMYFGKYYSAKKLPGAAAGLTPLPDEKLAQKQELCRIYRSQERVMDKLSHMFPYEEWEEAELQ